MVYIKDYNWSSLLHNLDKELKPTLKILVHHDKIVMTIICFTKRNVVLLRCKMKSRPPILFLLEQAIVY
ncbi:hypothetical protein EDF66_104159 [Sphingobacterium sp. JUb20]|nr:hypothetical protein [Sphingobacterium sp. JUb21]TCR08054.1 hypothetical protein EDF66_104159 [Sphingobacterium sp. JUb20]